MPSNSIDILTQNTHPDDSTVTTVTGDKYRGDGYYGRSDGLHTTQHTLNGFVGSIKIQATLAVNPTADDWFTVVDEDYTDSATTTGSFISNFTGNYVWIRAVIDTWTAGTVENIKLNH